ncbi:hypothetical protein Tco_0774362 [Tanacetum coccineum]|uniref:Uncharacterized protein n=1 Tax=Tanacetum coccineum TaxID=301880 RepID=A0ABQ4ZQV8_9ASTR
MPSRDVKETGLDECVSMSTPMETERLDVMYRHSTDQRSYSHDYGQTPQEVQTDLPVPLRQSYNMGLWYPKDSGFELIAYSDADHAGCKDDCKSTSGGLQFLGGKLVSLVFKEKIILRYLCRSRICFLAAMLCSSDMDAYSTA